MEHHTTDVRDLHWENVPTIVLHGTNPNTTNEEMIDMMNGGVMKSKSRRSITEAERGLKAEPNALRPPTTKAGKQRIRMKWSDDVNKFIMKTYYTITSNETQTKSYRDNLHRLFAQQYPDVAISQQRIADQRRAIVKNNLLPKGVLEEIKEEVAQSLQMKSYVDPTGTMISIKQEHVPAPVETSHIVTNHVSLKPVVVGHLNNQQQQHQHQQQHPPPHIHLHHSHAQSSATASHGGQHSTPIHIQTTGGVHHTAHTTRIHQASPTTAAALQNQPHIIIRVNTANPSKHHHFSVDDGSSI